MFSAHGLWEAEETEAGVAKAAVAPVASAEATRQRMPWEVEPGVAKASATPAPITAAKQRMPWEVEPGVAKSSPAVAPGPAKQRMPWETEPGVAKANAQTAKAEPARQRMPWETESGVAKTAGAPPKAGQARQRMPWEAKPQASAQAAGASTTTSSAPTPQGLSGKWVLLPDPQAADDLLATGKAIDSRPVNGLPGSAPAGKAGGAGAGTFVRQAQGKASSDAKVLRFEDLDWDGSGSISKEDLMNVLIAFQTQQVTIEMPNVQMEAAKAKEQPPQPKPSLIYGTCVHCNRALTDDSTFCRHCGMRRVESALDWDADVIKTQGQGAEVSNLVVHFTLFFVLGSIIK
ncbi:unnamed protein product [Symbiodinium natans]|uniref:EF-hand domain-containing protein n=1 Tax=Symbiodinium natans TaxID=878477 RepID=A0A812R9G1_9DINO|nr:unnamed protein product [Symbiodinium natans]